MALDVLKRYNTQLWLALCLAISGAYAFPINQANAQITPDTTLPTGERSELDLGSGEVNGKIVDLIKGGAIRDINLFHSFLEFNVENGQRVYFANPAGIENILSRVTGANPSNILGTLGVDGGANLFLINPNGIFFGDKAKLDVSGSFVGTTADGIGFGNQGVFSASNPEPPSPLLTVNPNVFFFNQIPGNITSQANLEKLAVDNLLLLGGDVEVKDSKISTNQGGNILLAGLGAPGQVALTRDGDKLGLGFPDGVNKGNVVITNSAIETFVAKDSNVDGGEIRIIADSLEVENSENKTDRGIFTKTENNGQKSGDISISADNSVLIKSTAREKRQGIFTTTEQEGGEGGKITIDTGSLTVETAEIEQGIFTTTKGNGQKGGDIIITADDSVSIIASNTGNQHGIFTLTTNANEGELKGGPGGSIQITAGSLVIESRRQNPGISAITGGDGDSGSITIDVTGDVLLKRQGTIKTEQRNSKTKGSVGNISLKVNGNVTLADYSRIKSQNSGKGTGGKVTILAGGAVEVKYDSKIESIAQKEAEGNSGSIEIEADSLLLDARKDPSNPESERGLVQITTKTESKTTGDGGDINIRVGSLTMIGPNKSGSSGITANTSGDGSAGKITIIVEGDFIMKDRAKIEAKSEKGATGNGNDIIIEAGSLFLSNRSFITTEARPNSKGNPGNITITAKDKIELNNSDIEALVRAGAGNPETAKNTPGGVGNITITARSLSLKNGGKLEAFTQGKLPAGNITVNATDFVEVSGKNANRIVTETRLGAQSVGDNEPKGGKINITTGKLTVSNDSFISTRSIGKFQGGEIEIKAKEVEVTEGGKIISTALNSSPFEIVGITEGGELETKPLSEDNGDPGNAGTITINASEQVIVSGSAPDSSSERIAIINNILESQKRQLDNEDNKLNRENRKLIKKLDELQENQNQLTEADIKNLEEEIEEIEQKIQDIEIRKNEIKLEISNAVLVRFDDDPDSMISVAARGGSQAGDLTVTTENLTVEDGTKISVSAVPLTQNGFPETDVDESELGVAGTLSIKAESLTLDNGQLVAATGKQTNNEQAATIEINVPGVIILDNNSLILASAIGDANGGNIDISGGVLVALPLTNDDKGSDIFANAQQGDGGKINITLQGLFNMKVLEDTSAFIDSSGNIIESLAFENNDSEIAALSLSSGESGTVTRDITGSAQDPENLPTSLVDPSALIVANCASSGKAAVDELGEFIITGRGGLPPSPLDPMNSQSVWVDLRILDPQQENIEEATSTPTPEVSYLPMRGKRRTAETPTPARPKKIVEAQGWTVGEDGTIILTAQPNHVTPKSNWYIPRSCGSKG
ncbi:MAG: filamentous hemagglutinin N-terminal domain-containing protein [Moorea sp. SIOASIH]|uniref:two-partner secretion domain-containing protein n=1 Tax=Moorena sp. SIOASIH TaxID=2607817 RepID=UPI0013BDA3EC|nr:filamentous hemagglutinin N-terminal domain-containing protein [Moorena sp. SIOASIH]NEO35430.1 filamentous hemagglutinin N-terminal domain-containing protein [Moorena sp. SIOASIH]